MKTAFKDNQKLFFGTLRKARQNKTTTLRNVKDENGEIISDEANIMERWRQYLKTLLEGKEISTKAGNKRKITLDRPSNSEKDSTREYISTEEVKDAIRKMKSGSAPGHDEITVDMIKAGSEMFIEAIKILMNKVIETEEAPQDWQIGIITPIFKKGDSRECNNYRGITLLSTIAKTFARVLDKKIRLQLDNTLEESQYGFRPNRSVQDANFILRQICEKTIKENREIHLCFIDLEKAFDRINRDDIWSILERRGIEQSTIKGIKSMYKETKNYVRTHHETSKMFETTKGVRQGCILSPMLFSLVLDEAIKEAKIASKQCDIGLWKLERIKVSEICYADDIVLIAKDENTLNQNLIKYNRCLEKINMKINSNKTKTMVVCKTEKIHKINMEGKFLEQVKNFKYLGSIISQDGKFEEEIKARIATTGKLFNSIKYTFLAKKEIPKETKIQVFKKVATPVLIYGSEVWTTTKKQRQKIQSMEMRFLRKIEGKTRLDKIRNSKIRENLKTKPIETVVEEGQLRWYGHIMRMTDDKLVKRIYEARTQIKQQRGRPRKTWTKEVKVSAVKRGIRWTEVRQIAQDRKKWKEAWKSTPIQIQ